MVRKTRWDDIAVLPVVTHQRRRLELSPQYHFTLNNPLIRHHAVGAQINLLPERSPVARCRGSVLFPAAKSSDVLGTYFLIGAQDKALPAVNKLIFSALLDFGYVPVAGKFALFNRAIVHWKATSLLASALSSEVIPVKRSDPAFRTISAIFDIGGVAPVPDSMAGAQRVPQAVRLSRQV